MRRHDPDWNDLGIDQRTAYLSSAYRDAGFKRAADELAVKFGLWNDDSWPDVVIEDILDAEEIG